MKLLTLTCLFSIATMASAIPILPTSLTEAITVPRGVTVAQCFDGLRRRGENACAGIPSGCCYSPYAAEIDAATDLEVLGE